MQSSPPWCSPARPSPCGPRLPPFDVVVRPPWPAHLPVRVLAGCPAGAERGNDPIAALYVRARHSVVCMYVCVCACSLDMWRAPRACCCGSTWHRTAP